MRHKAIKIFLVLMLFLVGFSPGQKVEASGGSLIISEINYSGSVDESKCKTTQVSRNRCGFDKWLEIHNPTGSAINLKNWKISFRNSTTKADTITITKDATLPAGAYYLVSYDEVNFKSTLKQIGLSPDGTSGKVSRISNNSQKTVQAKLINSSGVTVFDVDLGRSAISNLEKGAAEGNKHSIEYVGGSWQLATNEYYNGNFGTPRGSGFVVTDLDVEIVEEPVIVTEPVVEPQPVETVPEMVPSPSSEIVVETKPQTAIETEKVIEPVKVLSASESWQKSLGKNPVKNVVLNLDSSAITSIQTQTVAVEKLSVAQPNLLTIPEIVAEVLMSQEFVLLVITLFSCLYLALNRNEIQEIIKSVQNSLALEK